MNTLTPSAKTIQIFLPTGNPRGIRSAEMTTRTVRLIEVPRIHMKEFLTMEDSAQVGLYFLVGSDELNRLPQLYIGQSGELRNRIQQHNLKKDFWERAFVMLSTNNTITQTHALYLEYKAIEIAKQSDRYEILNGNNGSLPHTPAPLKADCEELFHTLSILLSTMGQPVFESLGVNNRLAHRDKPPLNVDIDSGVNNETLIIKTEPMLFYCKVKDGYAKGYYDDDGFVVLAGSLIRRQNSSSIAVVIAKLKESLSKREKLIVIDEDAYELTENQIFKTPSAGSQMVLARASNGWVEWRNAEGQTLSSIYR